MKSAWRWQEQRLILQVYVQPNAKNSQIVGLHGDYLKVRIAASAEDGKANVALIDFFAEFFGVAKQQIQVIKGHQSRNKQICINAPQRNLEMFK